MHMIATKHFEYGFLLSTPKERKEIKLFTRESSQQVKEEREIFLGFLLIITTSMEIKLTIFFVFLKVYQTHKKKARKRKLNSPRCTEECHLDTTGWRSPPDPTDNRMVDKGQVVVPAQALELMSAVCARTQPSARQGNGL